MQTIISTKQRMEWGMSARGTVVGVTGVAIEQVTGESLGGVYVVARPWPPCQPRAIDIHRNLGRARDAIMCVEGLVSS